MNHSDEDLLDAARDHAIDMRNERRAICCCHPLDPDCPHEGPEYECPECQTELTEDEIVCPKCGWEEKP
jgi:hypothetical protein